MQKNSLITLSLAIFTGLILCFLLFGSVIHESSHALMCQLFGSPYNYSLFQVSYDSSFVSPIENTIIRLAGGLGQMMFSLIFFCILYLFNSRNEKWFLIIVGFKIALLVNVFWGFTLLLWEGFFNDSYIKYGNNIITSLIMLVSLTGFSISILKKCRELEPK